MKYSVLDLAYLRKGETYTEAFENQTALAKAAESYGYERFWIAEHHNSKSIGSSATELLIQRALANTEKIRVGSGGVMLPNQSPYLVAERYKTLEVLFPGRLDLGLGRAPGTDMKTAKAIRRTGNLYPDFESDLKELTEYLDNTGEVCAYPHSGNKIPVYILGSSTDSAYLAAKLGLPYSFAAHFAPTQMEEAVRIYRDGFQPSEACKEPYVILGVNAILADTDEEAQRLSTSHLLTILGIVTGRSDGLLPPKDSKEEVWRDYIAAQKVPHFGPVAFDDEKFIGREKAIVNEMTAVSLIGCKESFAAQLDELKKRVEIDEIMVNSFIYDKEAQIYSLRLLSEVMKKNF